MYDIKHHGAVNGVTGSCHQLSIDGSLFSNLKRRSVLIDCGLFQGYESFDRESADDSSPEAHIKSKSILLLMMLRLC